MNQLTETLIWLCLSFYGLIPLGGLVVASTWVMWTFDGPIPMEGETYDRVISLGKWMMGFGFVAGILLQAVLILATI